jgi:HTH-type transcriptional regulator / antitoxin HigA
MENHDKKKATSTRLFRDPLPGTYRELCAIYLPRPIHDDHEIEEATKVIDELSPHQNLNADQLDYLYLVTDLVEAYERAHAKQLSKASGLAVLRYLMAEHRISTRALGRILGTDESLGAKILSGSRSITIEHAKKLGMRFNVKPTAFLDL